MKYEQMINNFYVFKIIIQAIFDKMGVTYSFPFWTNVDCVSSTLSLFCFLDHCLFELTE